MPRTALRGALPPQTALVGLCAVTAGQCRWPAPVAPGRLWDARCRHQTVLHSTTNTRGSAATRLPTAEENKPCNILEMLIFPSGACFRKAPLSRVCLRGSRRQNYENGGCSISPSATPEPCTGLSAAQPGWGWELCPGSLALPGAARRGRM